MKLQRHATQSIDPFLATQTERRRDIEEESQIRSPSVRCDAIELPQLFDVATTCIPLVHHGGVGMAVAQDHTPFSQCRFDHFRYVLGSVR